MGNQQTARQFSAKDIAVLVKLSGKSEDEIHQWYKDFHIESDETDRMNKRQFQLYYTKLKKNPKLEQITDHIFRAFDTDHSGTIDFSKFLLAYIATSTGTKRQKFEYAFEVFDINDNDRIEKKEAEKILNIICRIVGLPEEDAKIYTETLMLSFDANQDKILTKSEFIDGCLLDATLAKIADPFNF
ncbi:unnamed protein product [Adineta steineri]|uniref:EF-hand domain-containing protein n=1 Tax=Adineta steineri TaxID=433720 RepID=A0A813M322_9BILA|nr:unnamed protein product [Adineta steineri]CAF3501701.1 unnamed protein product [Adineta steineri]